MSSDNESFNQSEAAIGRSSLVTGSVNYNSFETDIGTSLHDKESEKVANDITSRSANSDSENSPLLDMNGQSDRSDFFFTLSQDEDEENSEKETMIDPTQASSGEVQQSVEISSADAEVPGSSGHANHESGHSDMDTSVSVASYSADNEFPVVNRRRRSRQEFSIPEDASKEHWSPNSKSPESNRISKSPPELRTFPISPFGTDRQWNASSGLFPSSFDSNLGSSNHDISRQSYGTLDPSWSSNSNDFSKLPSEKGGEYSYKDADPFLAPPSPPDSPRSPYTTAKQYDDINDCSSSERTPILSNHTRTSSHDFGSPRMKTPSSIQTIHEDNSLVAKEELSKVLRNSPSRNALTSPGKSRPEPLHKVLGRQKIISRMVEDLKGKRQPTSCRDIGFAIFYLLQILIIMCLGLRFGPEAFGLGEEDDIYALQRTVGIHFAYADVLIIALISGVVAICISAITFTFMAVFTKEWIPMALRLATVLSIILTIVGLIQTRQTFVPLLGLFAIALTLSYAFMVWDDIPFVSGNLFTALTACRSTFAILGIAIVTQIFALVWIVIYFFTAIGVHNYFEENDNVNLKLRIWAFIGLGLSFNWTIQAMMNMMEVCIAGYISWWWSKSNLQDSQKLDAIGESLVRAVVYSFGSVCFGSMFIGLVNALRGVADQIRPYREEAPIKFLVVVQEFIVSCVDLAASVFNEYAMINIGMYGYEFLEAGKQANNLFQKRGWHDIVSNSLLNHLLIIISIVVAGLTGCVSVEIERVQKLPLVSATHPLKISFWIGFSVGFVLSNILFNVITSSVKSVVLCFAGRPDEFQQNHPECSRVMRQAWKKSFPGLVDFVDSDSQNRIRGRSPSISNLKFKRESLESLYV